MEHDDEFFRTLISLDNGERLYEAIDGQIICRRCERRRGVEMVQRAMVARENVAYSPDLNAFRPAWAFPPDVEIHPVVKYINQPASEPLDTSAHLVTGEPINETTSFIYIG